MIKPRELKVIAMVDAMLSANGYDGLFNDVGECGCEIGDLSPGSCMTDNCMAGYKSQCRIDKDAYHVSNDKNFKCKCTQEW